ncbi:MAG: hypothetical protein H0U79_05355 [Solirubrobacterales bacterium]|nr:hypothetical protein [Solirubrobacterales bacterium]
MGRLGDRLLRAQAGLHSLDFPDDDAIEFHLSHGQMLAVLRDRGFEVEALRELHVPPGAAMTRFEWLTPEWATRWPHEEIWVARKQ